MPDLVEYLVQETGYPWKWHRSRDAAVLFFGRLIQDGPSEILSHCVIVWSDGAAEWHCDVLRRPADDQTAKALRVPGSMTWATLLEFVGLLVEKMGAPPAA